MKNETIHIHKLDHNGTEVWNYFGEVIHRTDSSVVLRAVFDQKSVRTGKITLESGDIFEEYFYTDRWYNIFKIIEPRTGTVKGWYCNLTRPAVITPTDISADDLALDFLVYPDRTWEILDQEDFSLLDIDGDDKKRVEAALQDLQRLVETGVSPFNFTD